MLVQSVRSQGYMMIWCAVIRNSSTIYKSSRLQERKHKQKYIIHPRQQKTFHFSAISCPVLVVMEERNWKKKSEIDYLDCSYTLLDHLFEQCQCQNGSLVCARLTGRKEHSSSCAKTCAFILWTEIRAQRAKNQEAMRTGVL